MTAAALIVLDDADAPGAFVAGSGDDYGVVTLGNVMYAMTEAQTIAASAASMSHEELAAAVARLAEEVAHLAAEVHQIASGVSKRRIAVLLGDD